MISLVFMEYFEFYYPKAKGDLNLETAHIEASFLPRVGEKILYKNFSYTVKVVSHAIKELPPRSESTEGRRNVLVSKVITELG